MAFLGRKELIPYGRKGKWIYARQLRGTRIFAGVHKKGLYQPYWPEDTESSTPGQRQKRRRRLSERKFRRFEAGVASTSRGERLAILRGERKDLPTLGRALEFFENEVREDIISKEFFRLEKMPSAIQRELLRHGFAFLRARRHGIKREAVVQIYFLLRGVGGQINVGAFLTQATAVTDRLRETLNIIYAWCRKYTDESQALEAIQKQFDETLRRLEQQLALWRRHEVFSRGRTSELQQRILQDKMAVATRQLTPFVELQPFAGWVWFTIRDLDKAGEALSRDDWKTSRLILERVGLALKIKRKQEELDDLLWRLGVDEVLDKWDGDFYSSAIEALKKSFEGLAEKEQAANFKKSVCQEVLKYLQEAEAEALLPEKNFRKLKEPLKKAYLLL